jgi:signal peptidase II
MLNRRQWLVVILLPMLSVIAVDQLSKIWALASLDFTPQYSGIVQWRIYHNYGLMMSAMDAGSKLYTVILPAAFAAFLFYISALVQYFFPLISLTFRCGLAIITGGVLANIIDRIRLGYVVDFVAVVTGDFSTGIFNLADMAQWLGVTLLFIGYAKAGRLLYPKNERRKKLWIDSHFQGRICAGLIFIGACFALLSGVFSYTFLQEALAIKCGVAGGNARQLLQSFTSLYSGMALIFLSTLFVVGVLYSHRIVGPIRGFEGFMNDVIDGKNRNFKVRTHDEFSHLEKLANRFQEFINEKISLNPLPLEVGQRMPTLVGTTFDNKPFDMSYFQGRRAWVMLYRYATCPLCLNNLSENELLIDEAINAGIAVVAVFESRQDQFIKEDTGAASDFLQQCKIPLLADPERHLYRALKAQVLSYRGFRVSTLKTLWRARRRGFLQSSIDGKFGQLPAHLFIGADGKIESAFYGEHFTDNPSQALIKAFLSQAI